MSNTWKVLLASALVSGAFASFAQTPAAAPAAAAPAAKAAPAPAAAPAAAAMQTFVCKDGSSVSAANSKGTCKGHKGIDKDATAKLTTSSTAAPAAAAKPAAAAAPAAGAAPGGGPGQVWVNENTKVYHCQGDRYYGKTKSGKYMSEADAKAAGAHAAKGSKACS